MFCPENRDILSGQQSQSNELKEIREQLKIYGQKLNTKEQIKTKCLYILDQYIRERESMGFATSAKEKERLIQLAKQQIAKI
jgi:hypothetical protein